MGTYRKRILDSILARRLETAGATLELPLEDAVRTVRGRLEAAAAGARG